MLAPADVAVIRREPTLPGLATLLDPDAFLSLLQTVTPELCIDAGQPVYVRYKPRTNCLVCYRLQLRSGVVREETTVYAIAFAPGNAPKIDKANRPPRAIGRLGIGSIGLPDHLLALYAFPNDRALPALPDLMNEQRRLGLLQRLAPDNLGLRQSHLRTLRYKPERRYVAHVCAGNLQATLKLYHSLDYAAAGSAAFSSTGPLCVPRRIGHSQADHIQLFEWLVGEPLDELLHTATPSATAPSIAYEPSRLHTVAAALATLHAQRPADLRLCTGADEAQTVQRAADAVMALLPALADPVRRLARRLAEHLAREAGPLRAIHGDFSADQVLLLEDGRAALLDFDRAAMGDPMADLGSFSAQLQASVLTRRSDRRSVDPLVETFVRAYQDAVPHDFDARRLCIHTAARLLRLAVEPFRYRLMDWDQSMQAIVQLAEEVYEAQ